MSSSPVNITTIDLTHLWPEQDTISKARIREAGAGYTCQQYFSKINGFLVEGKKGNATIQRIIIPREYKNALRFLNFKIGCYKAALQLDFSSVNAADANGSQVLIGLDSMSRNIIFHSAVRNQFFSEVEKNHYKGLIATNKKPQIPMHPFIRSPTMDSWLLREFRDKVHDPQTVEKSAALPEDEDPLAYGMSSFVKSVRLF
jgi:hypothetical protein